MGFSALAQSLLSNLARREADTRSYSSAGLETDGLSSTRNRPCHFRERRRDPEEAAGC
jgi:hypothetical protein